MPVVRSALRARLARRQLLRLGFSGSALVLFAEVGGAFGLFLRPLRALDFGGKVAAGSVQDVLDHFRQQNDAPLLVTRGRFYLLHAPDGILAAFRRCTHLGCIYRFQPSEDQFHCPCHSSLFDKRTGLVRGGPATRPLDLFPIEIVDGVVVVDTDPREGHLIQRSRYEPRQATPLA